MKVRNKRGVSGTITLILIIFIAVVSVIVFYNVVKPILTEKSGSIERSQKKYLEELEKSIKDAGDKKGEAPLIGNYIIQFEDDSVIERKVELEKQAEENKEKGFLTQMFGIMPEDVDNEVKKYAKELEEGNKKIEDKILERIAKKKFGNKFKKVFNGVSLELSESEVEEIKKIEGVKAVYPNLQVNITLMDSVPLINADDVWLLDANGNDCSISGEPCLTGEGVTIAILDTGIDYTHPDLGGCFGTGCKVEDGWDFVTCESILGGGGCNTGYEKPEDNNPMDEDGHGTHVAATAAGNGVLKGVAPDAKIYAYRVLNKEGRGLFDWIIAGIERAVDLNENGIPCENPGDYADIISMSLGGFGNPDDAMSQTIDNAALCVIPVISAGNSGPDASLIGSPGTARKAITIGASFKKNYDNPFFSSYCFEYPHNPGIDDVACFSSRGPVMWIDSEGNEKYLVKPDVVAPGVEICAAQWDTAFGIDDDYNNPNRPDKHRCVDSQHVAISGTSMSAPHVSGVAALIKQAHPDWTPEEIKMAIRNTAIDIGKNINTQGYGRIDILQTLRLEGKPAIAELTIGGRVGGTINIEGTASGEEFASYTLYYGEGENPASWAELITSTTPISDGVLYSNFHTSLLNNGIHYFKLIVRNTKNEASEDWARFNTDYIEMITNLGCTKDDPGISGDKIVWEDWCDEDIYMYDLSTKEEKRLIAPSEQYSPDISGDRIVWADNRNGYKNPDIYMYDISTEQETQITTDSHSQTNPAIYADKIVWEDNRSDQINPTYAYDIYMYDISTESEIPIITDAVVQISPDISWDKIVWCNVPEYGTDQQWGIYMYDISTGENAQITTSPEMQCYPAISGNKIVWVDNRNGNGNQNIHDIYMYDLSVDTDGDGIPNYKDDDRPNPDPAETQITTGGKVQSDSIDSIDISGDRIVWADNRNGNPDIYMYDISTGQEKRITFSSGDSSATLPSIDGNKIVWRFCLDMYCLVSATYMYILPEEISSCQELTEPDTTYVLTRDLSGAEVTAKCMNIKASGITLDCQGHSIKNSVLEDVVIYSQADYVTIKNCEVQASSQYFSSLNNGKGKGIEVRASNNIVENNIVKNTFWGIAVNGYDNLIQDNHVEGNAKGIHLGKERNIVKNNLLKNNNKHQGWGLGVWGGYYNQFTNNKVYGGKWGIVLYDAAHARLECDKYSSNSVKDIYVYAVPWYSWVTGTSNDDIIATGISYIKKYIGSGAQFSEQAGDCSSYCTWIGDECV